MEEIIVVLVQLFFEVGIQFFYAVPTDLNSAHKSDRGCAMFMLHTFLGGFCGWVSALIVPHPLLHTPELRLANLIVAPLLAGGLAWGMAILARNRGRKYDATTYFWHGFLFALLFGLARLATVTR